jgi:hypothetical protein
MYFLLALAKQPLFRLLGAIIVLLITDAKPAIGAIAAVVWALWIFIGIRAQPPAPPLF